MQRSTKKLPSGNVEIREGKRRWLGIQVASRVKPAVLAGWSFVSSDQGWIVDGETLREWKPEGCFEYEGDLYLKGPYADGVSLGALLLEREALPLEKLIPALLALKRFDALPSQLDPDSIQLLESGELFFLPESALVNRRKFQRSTSSRDQHEPYEGEQALVFALAELLYRVYTGIQPFRFLSGPHSAEFVRKGACVAPHLVEPNLSEEASSRICSALRGEGRLEDFVFFCTDDVMQEPDAEERQRRISRGVAHERRLRRAFARKRFFASHWRKIIVVTLVAGLLFSVVRTMLRGIFEVPRTQGLSAEALVQGYYDSINSLDHEYLRDSSVRGLSRALINEIIYLSVMNKMRSVYEPEFRFVDAESWIAAGRDPPGAATLVYGVAKLSVQRLAADRFQAEYEYWRPGEGGSAPEGVFISEVLLLEQLEERWRIVEFPERSSRPVTGEEQ